MIEELELSESDDSESKKETATNKVFNQTQIRKSIKIQRERIRYIMDLIEAADEELQRKKKVAKRNNKITNILNDDKND